MNDSSAELFYIFLSNKTLDIYKYELTKNNTDNSGSISSKDNKPTKWSNQQEELIFKYTLETEGLQSVSDNTSNYINDLMLTSANNSKNICIETIITSSGSKKIEIKLEEKGMKRNECCDDKKNKNVNEFKEISKIQEWCSTPH